MDIGVNIAKIDWIVWLEKKAGQLCCGGWMFNAYSTIGNFAKPIELVSFSIFVYHKSNLYLLKKILLQHMQVRSFLQNETWLRDKILIVMYIWVNNYDF